MKARIDIEDFDNGITLKWGDGGEHDEVHIVALEAEKESTIGKAIWDDVRYVMEKELVSKVRMVIQYEPIKEE